MPSRQRGAHRGQHGSESELRNRRIMTIGTGIALLVIGATLVFAVNAAVQHVDLDLIGYILMGANGVVILQAGGTVISA